jgi:hypothetical protein
MTLIEFMDKNIGILAWIVIFLSILSVLTRISND